MLPGSVATGRTAAALWDAGPAAATDDVEVILPLGKGKITRKGVKANELLTVKE